MYERQEPEFQKSKSELAFEQLETMVKEKLSEKSAEPEAVGNDEQKKVKKQPSQDPFVVETLEVKKQQSAEVKGQEPVVQVRPIVPIQSVVSVQPVRPTVPVQPLVPVQPVRPVVPIRPVVSEKEPEKNKQGNEPCIANLNVYYK